MIYAVDFDGTLCESRWPEIGPPNVRLIEFLKEEQEKGSKVILWTMREEDLLDEALKWLRERFGFIPDEVNDNLPEQKKYYGDNPRKVFANVYIDDHNAKYGICADVPFMAERTDIPEFQYSEDGQSTEQEDRGWENLTNYWENCRSYLKRLVTSSWPRSRQNWQKRH